MKTIYCALFALFLIPTIAQAQFSSPATIEVRKLLSESKKPTIEDLKPGKNWDCTFFWTAFSYAGDVDEYKAYFNFSVQDGVIVNQVAIGSPDNCEAWEEKETSLFCARRGRYYLRSVGEGYLVFEVVNVNKPYAGPESIMEEQGSDPYPHGAWAYGVCGLQK